MHKTPAVTPITTASLLRGLTQLPWGASLFAPLPGMAPGRR